MSVLNVLNTGIMSALTGSTALMAQFSGTPIFFLEAPVTQDYPFIVWDYQYGGGPMGDTSSDLREERPYIRVYDTNRDRAGTIDKLIANAIDRQTLTVSGYTNFFTRRVQDFSDKEHLTNGQLIFMAGGVYLVQLDD